MAIRISGQARTRTSEATRYTRLDRELDRPARPESDISTVIGPCGAVPEPARRPLRDRVEGSPAATGIRVRVYGKGEDMPYMGMAMSADSLLALIEKCYEGADVAVIKGKIDGEMVSAEIGEESFEDFRMALAL